MRKGSLVDSTKVWPMTNSGVAIGCGIPFFPSDYSVEMYSVLIGEAVREILSPLLHFNISTTLAE